VCICVFPGWGGEEMEGRKGESGRKEEKHTEEED
jgi:hypothetical protein